MRRAIPLTLTMIAVVLTLAAAGSRAAGGWRTYKLTSPQAADDKFKARPGVFDPDKIGAVDARWVAQVGLADDRGNGNFALYLQKAAPTTQFSAAGAVIDGVEGKPAGGVYGFDYRNGGQCGAGSPRYNLEATDGFHFIGGCANGTQAPVPGAPGWTRVTFNTSDPTQSFPVVAPGATIISLTLIVDEGTDTGPGYIYTDNLNINGQYITKPGASK
jgi:hypothetical protein